MEKKIYPALISERENHDWIPTCPIQVKKIRIFIPAEGELPQLVLFTEKCTDKAVHSCTVSLFIQNDRREEVGCLKHIQISPGESAPITCPYEKAVFASAVVEEVQGEDLWIKTPELMPVQLPEQDIFWQTDPLYEQIKQECSGIVAAKYKPDQLDDGWRCACGQINLLSSEQCGACGCSRQWLHDHLDRAYLEKKKENQDSQNKREHTKKSKQKNRESSDKIKAILLISSILAVILLVVLTIQIWIPSVRYHHAENLVEKENYDEAIQIFADLGNFKDAKKQVSDTVYKQAQKMTGLEEVYLTTSAKEPWFSISEDGVLTFKKDTYEKAKGTWNHFVIPDMVDGILVRALDRNFLINCKDLQAVTISDCVEVIGEQSFLNCESLHTIHFGKNVREIAPRTFIDCHALEEITIPDTVESIGVRAFNNCLSLRKVVLGKGITSIPDYLFSLCVKLESVTFSSPITSVGENAFSECSSLKTIFCRFSKEEAGKTIVETGNDLYTAAKISYDN